MSRGEAEVWVIPSRRVVLVTEHPGPPAEICGYVSEAAEAAHKSRGGLPTISEIGFPSDCYFGAHPVGDPWGWGKAGAIAEANAQVLGYTVEYEAFILPDDDEEDDLVPFPMGYGDWP